MPEEAAATATSPAGPFEMTDVPGDENLPVEDLSDHELEDARGGNGGNGPVVLDG